MWQIHVLVAHHHSHFICINQSFTTRSLCWTKHQQHFSPGPVAACHPTPNLGAVIRHLGNDQHDDRTAHNKTSRDPGRSKHPKSISSQRTPKKREMTSFLWLSFISLCWLSFIFIGPEMPKILLAKKQKCKGWKLEEAKVHPGGRWQTWLQAASYPLSESENLHPLIFALRCKFKNLWALMYIRPFRWQGHREGFSSEAS